MNIEEIALRVAQQLCSEQHPAMQYGVNAEFTINFAHALLAELSKDAVPEDTSKGFHLWFDREAWGNIIDGLMLERERSLQRKSSNPESNSNGIADRCAELIAAIRDKAAAAPRQEK